MRQKLSISKTIFILGCILSNANGQAAPEVKNLFEDYFKWKLGKQLLLGIIMSLSREYFRLTSCLTEFGLNQTNKYVGNFNVTKLLNPKQSNRRSPYEVSECSLV